MARELTPAMRRLIKDCVRWGEIGPDAEDVAGCHGAAFNRVVGGLISRGLLKPDGSISDILREELNAAKLRPDISAKAATCAAIEKAFGQ
jgi:hypothetical protein